MSLEGAIDAVMNGLPARPINNNKGKKNPDALYRLC